MIKASDNGKVRQERTGWRDEALSGRHRAWGYNCPATDIDFIVIEYNAGEPVALVEYKHEVAKKQFASHPTYRALIGLGNRACLPVFAVRYANDFSWWRVVPLNQIAKRYLPETKKITEKEWVTLLYKLRGLTLPDGLFKNLYMDI